MNRTIAVEKEKRILELYRDRLERLGNEPELSSAEENGIADILSLEYQAGDDIPVLAQYNFVRPVDEEVDTLLFSQNLCLRDDIESDELKLALLQAVNVVNYMLPFGYFGFDTSLEILSYRYSLPVDAEQSAQDAEESLAKNTLSALGLVVTFASPLVSFIDGKIDWNGFLEAVGAVAAHYQSAE